MMMLMAQPCDHQRYAQRSRSISEQPNRIDHLSKAHSQRPCQWYLSVCSVITSLLCLYFLLTQHMPGGTDAAEQFARASVSVSVTDAQPNNAPRSVSPMDKLHKWTVESHSPVITVNNNGNTLLPQSLHEGKSEMQPNIEQHDSTKLASKSVASEGQNAPAPPSISITSPSTVLYQQPHPLLLQQQPPTASASEGSTDLPLCDIPCRGQGANCTDTDWKLMLDYYTFSAEVYESAVGPGVIVRIWEREWKKCRQNAKAPITFFRVSVHGAAFAAVDTGPLILGQQIDAVDHVPSGHRAIIPGATGIPDAEWSLAPASRGSSPSILRGLQTFLLLPDAGAYNLQVKLMLFDVDSGHDEAGRIVRMIHENFPLHSKAYESIVGGQFVNKPLRASRKSQSRILLDQTLPVLVHDTIMRFNETFVKQLRKDTFKLSNDDDSVLAGRFSEELYSGLFNSDISGMMAKEDTTGALVIVSELLSKKYAEKYNPASLPLCGSPQAEELLRSIARAQMLPIEDDSKSFSSRSSDVAPLNIAFNLRGRWLYRSWMLREEVLASRANEIDESILKLLPRELSWCPWQTQPLWYLNQPNREIDKTMFVPYFCQINLQDEDSEKRSLQSKVIRGRNLLEIALIGPNVPKPIFESELASARWTHLTGDSNTRYIFDFTCLAAGGQILSGRMDPKRDPPILCVGPPVTKQSSANHSLSQNEAAVLTAMVELMQNTSMTMSTKGRVSVSSESQVHPSFVMTFSSWFWGKRQDLEVPFKWREQCFKYENDDTTWSHKGWPLCDNLLDFMSASGVDSPTRTWHGWGCHAAEFGLNPATDIYFQSSPSVSQTVENNGGPFRLPYHSRYATLFPLTTAGNPELIPSKFGRQQLMRNNERMWATNQQLSHAIASNARRESFYASNSNSPKSDDWLPIIDTWSPTYAAYEYLSTDAVHFRDHFSNQQPLWLLHWWKHAPNFRTAVATSTAQE